MNTQNINMYDVGCMCMKYLITRQSQLPLGCGKFSVDAHAQNVKQEEAAESSAHFVYAPNSQNSPKKAVTSSYNISFKMPLFRSSGKSPKEVVSELRETLLYLAHPTPAAQTTEGKRPSKKHRSRGAGRKHEHSDADLTKAAGEECAALLTSLKSILFPDVAVPGDKSQLVEVVRQCYDAEVLLHLVRASVLEELPTPEVRYTFILIFSTVAIASYHYFI